MLGVTGSPSPVAGSASGRRRGGQTLDEFVDARNGQLVRRTRIRGRIPQIDVHDHLDGLRDGVEHEETRRDDEVQLR